MDVVGSEIGQKMRSAIKAKLTELGCYVDDELPDYVMVMVANKRTRSQMEDDLQLFLGDNTELFVNWLHQVLKKLQEVTVTAPIKITETDISKECSQSKERKSKEKKVKDKSKKNEEKKSKKKEKSKSHHRRKIDKKSHKSKKKSKTLEMIRPNIPPLLMNIEKDSEPSITDVFAGQILKNHGIILDQPKEPLVIAKKPIVEEVKRPIRPIIDPASIPSQSNPSQSEESNNTAEIPPAIPSLSTLTREEHLKEMNMIEDKMQGLKQKLAEQLEAMSDEEDEDFLNIRTEADELMNDFAEDVFQEGTHHAVTATPPLKPKSPPPPIIPTVPEEPKKDQFETLPQIELNLPKRPVRERLGTREEIKRAPEVKKPEKEKRTESPERFTPERQPAPRPSSKSIKNRLGDPIENHRKSSTSEDNVSNKCETSSKKLTSRVSVLDRGEGRGVRGARAACASVVRVRPRPRVGAPASSLLMKAVAEAHKSLLNTPPKIEPDVQKVKRALVRPMRRTVEPQKIIIQVPADSLPAQADTEADTDRQGDTISLGGMDSDDDKSFKGPSDTEKEEYIPAQLTKKITNTEYVPSRRHEFRTTTRKDDSLVIETLNIHNPTANEDRKTQFIVTMDGYDPNAFLTKKLQNEGLLNDDEDVKPKEIAKDKQKGTTKDKPEEELKETQQTSHVQTKRLSNESEESDTQVIIKEDKVEVIKRVEEKLKQEAPQGKKRKGSPIVFDVGKKEKEPERMRVRTESASSDNHVTVTTTTNTHKYDSVPPLSGAERKLVWCRSFPLCRYGAACAFLHPRCKFLAACTRRACVYSHSPSAPPAPAAHAAHAPHAPHTPLAGAPAIASHVVPAANYKTISSVSVPGMCKYYPGCANPACHYYHPKPCRYGNNCANKLECNFYHSDVPAKWRYAV